MTAADHPQVQAMAALYRPPGPTNGSAPTVGAVRGAECAGLDGLQADGNTIIRLRALLPVIVLETKIALDVARDLYLTGGCEIEDGKRLRTAYERLKRAAEIVADAEREVHG